MNRDPLTRAGADRLREELKRLKQTERPRIIEAIAEARAHGDLKENAEYHAAREQQGIIDVKELDPGGKVVFGATVTVADEAGEETRYQIVGDLEADIKQNRIAISSPIARALIGKEEGDVGVVAAPGGERELEIVEVEYL